MSAACAFEHGGHACGVHAFGGFAVDGENLVAGADAGFIGRGTFEGIEDDDFGFAAGGGLRLDGHADTIVLAVLILAHLSEGLGIVEVGVGIENVKHAGNGAVVDGLIGFVGVEGLGVVLLDKRVDVGKGVEGVAEGGLIAGGLGGDLLINEGADDGAGGKKNSGREESAVRAGSHGLGYTSNRNGASDAQGQTS